MRQRVKRKPVLNRESPDIESKLRRFDVFHSEANEVREQDKLLVDKILKRFQQQGMEVGVRYQRAYGSMLSGDYFDLVRLPSGESMFILSDAKGHGLPAYTTLIRLRSAVSLAVKDMPRIQSPDEEPDTAALVRDIGVKFTDIMEESASTSSVCACFTFISQKEDHVSLKFYNRGMPFPLAIKSGDNGSLEPINLNEPQLGWKPATGSILGSDFRGLMGDSYFDLPECRYTLPVGSGLFFYSDGVTEACGSEDADDFGYNRLSSVIKDCVGLLPQVAIDYVFEKVYNFIGGLHAQQDDMTAVYISFPFFHAAKQK